MLDRLATGVTVILVLAALAIGGLSLQRSLAPRPEPLPEQGRLVADWRALFEEPAEEADSSVSVLVFADYTCVFCRSMEEPLDSLRRSLGPGIRIRQVHFPLRMDGPGFAAAVASECAKQQGSGAEYHRLLYRHQEELGRLAWDGLAARAGVPNLESFRACLSSTAAADVVRRDRSRGDSVGVNMTPALLIGGRLYFGAAGYSQLATAVARAAPAPVAP